MAKQQICSSCGSQGKTKNHTRGRQLAREFNAQ